jgi:hypothetical protein
LVQRDHGRSDIKPGTVRNAFTDPHFSRKQRSKVFLDMRQIVFDQRPAIIQIGICNHDIAHQPILMLKHYRATTRPSRRLFCIMKKVLWPVMRTAGLCDFYALERHFVVPTTKLQRRPALI